MCGEDDENDILFVGPITRPGRIQGMIDACEERIRQLRVVLRASQELEEIESRVAAPELEEVAS